MGIYDRDYSQAEQLRPLRPWDNQSMVAMLISANVAVYLGNFLFSGTSNAVAETLMLDSDCLRNPIKWWQLVTYGFDHDPKGIRHILFNMASLYFLGRSVEDRLGKWEFFRFYMFAIVVCGVVWCGLHGSSQTSLLGASGATTAVSMLFVFCYPNSTLMLMMAVPVKAWVVGVVIVASNLFSPMTSDGSVAYDVHLVGAALAAGYFYGGWNFGFLGSWFAKREARNRLRQSGLKVHRPSRNTVESENASPKTPSKDEQESDRILDKIYRKGEDSLTAKERRFLKRYSRQMRQQRRD